MASAYTRYKKKRIKEIMLKNATNNIINNLEEMIVNPTEDDFKEITEAIAEMVSESSEKQNGEQGEQFYSPKCYGGLITNENGRRAREYSMVGRG